ncbi:Peroxisome biogenesis protein 5 [Raphanus sativus]|uniref:Peroxisome biogenesis protein 5-like n=1 Tax=Raphanus sativus TaxID=3726 RepID=A0A9W3CKS0_RAPSA|nr:peroxisome biogenesis protein 5-like [Raphanus sativus]XP_056855630.1 peroxisome biogenesis protein 5-like [Raphanus sativus]KAJ4868557.1 Peroxisome biogenesis protein 5 [Raphanus sativus]KAJ4873378.1 Peroxisome biogenesis protein 5 [Raphanus sativus]
MAMRDLVNGGAACAVPGSSSSSNPLGALTNALLGSSSKTQERLKEIPNATSSGPGPQFYSQDQHLSSLPGSELDQPLLQPGAQGTEFFRGFRSVDQNGLGAAWDEVQRGAGPMPPMGPIYEPPLQPTFEGPPQRVLSNFLHSFVESSRGGIPFRPAPVPVLGLSQSDKQCIRDRSSIMARHFFADRGEEFINSQVNALLSSLDIDDGIQARGHIPGRFRELDDYWNESQAVTKPGLHPADSWAAEFDQHQHGMNHGGPDAWVNSFEQQHGVNGWATEFEQGQSQLMSNQMRSMNMQNLAAMEQTRKLAHTLSQDGNPKFQNSRFLQFVSKMSRGELIMDENEVKPGPAPGDWATEYEQQYLGPPSWADQFANEKLARGPEQWADEFASANRQQESAEDQWVNEFSKLNVDDWVDEFAEGPAGGSSADAWANAYDEFLTERNAEKQNSGVYVFSDMNPYVGHPEPMKEGQELFRKGLLSEAALALEAEVMKNPENAEGWRLLGVTHAENDDDQQAIAAMMRAQEADPSNLEVLLALGVSHTNELEQATALKYLYGWLRNHPKYGSIAPPELADSLYHADIARLFTEASQMNPEDADVHIVLGVLFNLSREFDRAITSFQTALQLKPNDYSLWNKLGATQANSVQSADAISAYQQALDLKPNYVRAWANMGISYANQGMYKESIPYYVRALAMNPKADNAWQYLRLSLSCASRHDLIEACEARNLDLLQKEFPL